MNAKQKLHQTHLREWAARFAEQKASGLTVRVWCEQTQISIHKYNYWKHLLKEKVVDQVLPDVVPLSLPASCPSSVLPAPQISHPKASDYPIRTNRAIRANYTNANIRLCIDGVAIEIDPSISEEFLRSKRQNMRHPITKRSFSAASRPALSRQFI